MPDATTPADRLRQRADLLHLLAGQLRHLHVLALPRDAGTDTWVGPSPQRCEDSLRAARAALLAQADELSATARRFERQAASLATVVPVGGPQ